MIQEQHGGNLSDLQVAVAAVFFGLDESAGYLVAGGAALVASELIARPTEDIDLFTAAPTREVSVAARALVDKLRLLGHEVVVVQDAPTFCRLTVSRGGESTLVDLAVDSPSHGQPTFTALGPTLAPLELAGRKLLALFGSRGGARLRRRVRVGRSVRKGCAHYGSPAVGCGIRTGVLAEMLGTFDRFDDDEIPLPAERRSAARTFFADWRVELPTRNGEN